MAKKKSVNKYGVREGDIFVEKPVVGEEPDCYFYQVTALRRSTQVILRPIHSVWVATDGRYMQMLPVLDSWICKKEEGMIKKVQEYPGGRYCIKIDNGMYSYAHPYDRKQVYLCSAPPVFRGEFERCNEEICKELDLKKGYGVYAVSGPFNVPLNTNCLVTLRRPGREDEEFLFYEML